MIPLPIVFRYRDLVAFNGAMLEIEACGRALLNKESDDSWWMCGVTPGALAAGDAEIKGAFSEFKQRYLAVIYDAVEEAESFKDLVREIERFFYQDSKPTLAEWHAAVEQLRAHREADSGLLAGIPCVNADEIPRVIVTLVDAKKIEPSLNRLDEQYAKAA